MKNEILSLLKLTKHRCTLAAPPQTSQIVIGATFSLASCVGFVFPISWDRDTAMSGYNLVHNANLIEIRLE